MLSQGLQMGLLTGSGLLLAGSVGAWYRQRMAWAVGLLMAAALLLRLVMAALDPFLHEWDERFHAVVAKNMMQHPLAPMLHPGLLPYDYKAWCCNHIWLHKQPLFMWQMALSMKLFGVNEVALRLPSALLGSLVLYPVYRLGRLLLDADTGYVAALLAAFAFYQLEQTSGVIGMDHNDVAFAAYVTASIWAYYEYRRGGRPWRWLVLVGVFAGAAVLCKWLPGLVVYAGWGVAILQESPRRWAEYGRLAASVAVAVAVALPWQLYSAWRFPLESAYERAYNTRHFFEPLEGHDYPWYYHFSMLPTHYGALLVLMALGLVLLTRRGQLGRLLPVLAMILGVYAFFTVAATRMYSYTYVVSALLLLLAAVALAAALLWLRT
ncbi:ArnT family glycosyltransferase, partial [Hymenobacter agri]